MDLAVIGCFSGALRDDWLPVFGAGASASSGSLPFFCRAIFRGRHRVDVGGGCGFVRSAHREYLRMLVFPESSAKQLS